MRQELATQGIGVTALHVSDMDTDMSDYVGADQKSDPATIAAAELAASLPVRRRSSPTRSSRA
jgi:NAD(P)-dependent dehydrogenase (short-subunit alcohol dehydrogenase family)